VFSPDGNYVYYVSAEKDASGATVYEVPALGGPTRKLVEDADAPVAISPDGAQLAFPRFDPRNGQMNLIAVNTDGSGERTIATRKLPASFGAGWFGDSGPGWSPDGSTIAVNTYATATGGNGASLVAIPARGGTERVISAANWSSAGRAAWLADGSGIVLTASEQGSGRSSQIWLVSYPGGEIKRITTDLNQYFGVSLTADSSALATVQSQAASAVWIAPLKGQGNARQLSATAGTQDGFDGIASVGSNRIIYSSNVNGQIDLWSMATDGSNPTQLTFSVGNARFPSSDGRTVVFQAEKGGRSTIWRMDPDGSNLHQLTHDGSDFSAWISPDGKWVLYSSLASGTMALWRVATDGGSPVRLSDRVGVAGTISPDGKQIAFQTFDQNRWKVGILSLESGTLVKTFDIPFGSGNIWQPDGKAFTYIDTHNGVSNIWAQPLTNGPPKQLTYITDGIIFNFYWAADGKRLTVSRGTVSSDVVLIHNLK
jgi:Tol biopolymer transport system component